MRIWMRFTSILAAGAFAVGASPALAAPKPWVEVSLASRGISKGLAQTDGVQGLARFEVPVGGALLGGYIKNVDSSSSDGEGAVSLGLKRSLAGVDLALSAALKLAVDPAPGSDATALEVAASASRKLGKLTSRLSLVWSPDDLGGTGHTLFAEAGGALAVAKQLSVSAAVGRRERSGGLDYTAFNAGISWSPAKPLTLDARYYDTDGGDAFPYRARGVVSAKVRF